MKKEGVFSFNIGKIKERRNTPAPKIYEEN